MVFLRHFPSACPFDAKPRRTVRMRSNACTWACSRLDLSHDLDQTYALLRRAGLEFPLSRASGHNCHGTASKHLLSNLDNLRSVRPGVLHGNTVEALPRALAPHSSLRLLPARFAKLAPRGAKFSPGGRLGLGPKRGGERRESPRKHVYRSKPIDFRDPLGKVSDAAHVHR